MANDINKEDPHYKGEYGSIYEVNRKFPTGGVAGDFVVIDGWAHYWNADRGTWCVNAERDSYWDELITNIIEKFKLVRGATYMGVASLDTVPIKVIGAKMYYFATVAGTYKNFDNLVVPQGINVLYSENGSSWGNTTLLEVAQELGVSTNKVVSQKALNDALNLKADQSSVNEALAKKADNKRVDDELAKKFDKESVVQESGEAEDKVMSQKAVSDKLSDLCDTFAGVAGKDATPKDGKVFYIGYESGVYPNFDNVECSLNGINILKRMYNGKFGNYFIGLDLPYAFQGNQAVNWGILDDYTFIHNNTSVTIKGKFNVIILFPYAKRTNLTKEFSIDVPNDSVSIVYAEVRKGKAEMFYCNIVGGNQETSFLKEIENKNGLAVVPLFIIDRGSEDIIPLLMMATGREDKENLDSYYNKASYAQKSDILPIKALIKTTFDKNFYGRIDTFSEEPSVFPYEAHKNGGLVVRDSIANEDGFLHQIKACVNGNGVFSLRVGLLDQRNMFVERSRTNIVLSLGNNTINVLDKHILIKKGETVALSITNDSATCSQFYERAQQSGEKTFLYSPSWDGVFSELATDFGGIVVFGFNMVSIESAFAYATDIEKTNETLNTIASKLNKQQYVYDADNNPYKLKVIDGELVPLPINYKKVLALGNSLTSHPKSEDIGYYGDESWAMASTNKVETTWTNYLERILKQKNVSASVTPFNIFNWETNPNNVDLDSLFSKVSDTDYDLIIFRAGENGNYVDTYQEGFDRLIRFLQNKYKRASIVVSEMFWHNSQKEAVFKKVADEHNLQYVNTGNINDRCLLGQMLMGIDNQFHPIVHNGVAGHCTDVCYCKYGNILANALGYDEIQNELHTVSVSTNKEYSINNTIQVYNGYVSILTYEDTKPVIEGVSANIISLKSANWINKPDKVPTFVSVFKMPNKNVSITIS